MTKNVAIVGAGPVGLAAAAHVMERGMTPIVLESGTSAGHAVRQWQHVQLFSPWEYNVDKAAARLLDATGWNSLDPHVYPTGAELLERFLDPLAAKTPLKDHILTSSEVTGISRRGFDRLKTKGREDAPFEIRYRNTAYTGGLGERVVRANAVIDASHSAIGTLTDLAELRVRHPEPTSFGCCVATIRQKPSAAAPTTNWQLVENLDLSSRHWSPQARSGSSRHSAPPT